MVRLIRLGLAAANVTVAVAGVVAALFLAEWVVQRWHLDLEALRPFKNVNDVHASEEFTVRVVTNEYGFRESRLPGPKPPECTRIVALGDSFTMGFGVEEDEAYPSLVEKMLRARRPGHCYEVINLGVGSTCPLDYLEYLRSVGTAYQPDVVMVGIMANDIRDLKSLMQTGGRTVLDTKTNMISGFAERRPWWKRLPSRLWPHLYRAMWARIDTLVDKVPSASASPTPVAARATIEQRRWRDVLHGLAERHGLSREEIDGNIARLSPEVRRRQRQFLTGHLAEAERDRAFWELVALVDPDVFLESSSLPPSYDEAWDTAANLLAQINVVARGVGARTVLVFIPGAHQVTEAVWPQLQGYGFHLDDRVLTDTTFPDRLQELGTRLDAPVIDLLAPLRAHGREDIYFPLDMHWTPAGHNVAADYLTDRLLELSEAGSL